tara:strand:+ start:735 stop:1298 length:564 start_codon:yes stop_codon:yes gene_type:complete
MKINKKYMGGGLNKKPATYNGGGVIGFIDDLLFGSDDDSGSSSGSGSGGGGGERFQFEGAPPASPVFRSRSYSGAQQYEDGGVPLKKKTIPQVGSEMPIGESRLKETDDEEMAKENRMEEAAEQGADQKQRELIMYMESMDNFARQYPNQFEAMLKEMYSREMQEKGRKGEIMTGAEGEAGRPKFME